MGVATTSLESGASLPAPSRLEMRGSVLETSQQTTTTTKSGTPPALLLPTHARDGHNPRNWTLSETLTVAQSTLGRNTDTTSPGCTLLCSHFFWDGSHSDETGVRYGDTDHCRMVTEPVLRDPRRLEPQCFIPGHGLSESQ